MDKIREFVGRYQLITFFAIAYTVTWAIWIPSFLLPYVGVISPWGAFGPALAGILITRIVYPERSDKSRKLSRLVFLLGLIVSVLVYLLNAWMQISPPWTTEIAVGLTFSGLIAAMAPAFVISSIYSRNDAIRGYLQSLIRPKGSVFYYLIALLIFPATFWLGSVISEAIGQAAFYEIPSLHGWDEVLLILAAFISQFFYGNTLGEEVGWRGFALPRLQAQTSPLVASLVIGLFWFAWHLPIKVINPDAIPYVFYGLSFIPQSIFLTWLFNRTKGSILAVGVAHVSLNVAGTRLFPPSYAWLILQFIVVAILILIDRMWENRAAVDSSMLHSDVE